MAIVGVSNLHYAIMLTDTTGGVTYSAPVKISNLINVDKKVNSNSGTLYADNGPAKTATVLGDITITIEIEELDLATRAALLGHTVTGGVMSASSADNAPYVALAFEGLKDNGSKKYIKYLKGMFKEVSEAYKTKDNNVTFQTPKLEGTFVVRTYDGKWEYSTEEDAPDYVAGTGAAWYTSIESGADTTPPTATCVPTGGATGVAVTADMAITFSEAISVSTVIPGTTFILQKLDGTQVAGAGTFNTGHTVYTFNPAASLDASTQYMVMLTTGIKDINNNALAAVNTFVFTTA